MERDLYPVLSEEFFLPFESGARGSGVSAAAGDNEKALQMQVFHAPKRTRTSTSTSPHKALNLGGSEPPGIQHLVERVRTLGDRLLGPLAAGDVVGGVFGQ